jgi:hypothetical protein
MWGKKQSFSSLPYECRNVVAKRGIFSCSDMFSYGNPTSLRAQVPNATALYFASSRQSLFTNTPTELGVPHTSFKNTTISSFLS